MSSNEEEIFGKSTKRAQSEVQGEEKNVELLVSAEARELVQIMAIALTHMRFLAPRDPISRGSQFWQRIR